MRTKNTFSLQIILLAALFLNACAATSQIDPSEGSIRDLDQETADLAEVKVDTLKLIEQAGKENVLVVFDIDNTLLAMEQGLGTDQWYEWQKEISKNDPCNVENVGDRFAVQGALYFASAMRRTQQDGAAQVQAIQDADVAVIALTSRGPEFRLQTFRELRRNDFSFSQSAIGPPGGYQGLFMPVTDGRFSRYEDGVFLTAGQHKGQMLYALLQKTGTALPAVIVMADDKQKNLDSVKETFSNLGVPVHAWRFTAEDENVRNFDSDQANTQWKAIEQPLRQLRQVLGPDNYDLTRAERPVECN